MLNSVNELTYIVFLYKGEDNFGLYRGVERLNNSISPSPSAAASFAAEESMLRGCSRTPLGVDVVAGEDGPCLFGNVELRESGLSYRRRGDSFC